MKFRDAAKAQRMGQTHNGMPTYIASGNPLVDLFSAIGSSRAKDLRPLFSAAYAYDRVKTLKILLWARDVRGGAGERQTVRDLLRHLEAINPEDAEQLVPYLPFFGRWDDLLVFQSPRLCNAALSVIAKGLTDPATAGLTAKWMPRKGKIALALERFLGMVPTSPRFHYTERKAYPGKPYRQMLATLTKVVEQQMCAREWDQIVFDHVPSLAAARYQKAFNRRCAERYAAYKAGLVKGTRTIHATTVYPYDVIKSINHGDRAVAKAQWEALPNYLGEAQMLAMVDVSGSMIAQVGVSNLTCLDISTSLGLYIADKAKGPFKDCFLTFSGSPVIEVLQGDILEKHAQMCRSHWTMNTDLYAAFLEILRVACHHNVVEADMPRVLLILSDMEFDACVTNPHETALTMMRRMYEEAGYTMPKVVFWNLRARVGNAPAQFRDGGTALVSGFSPAIMRSILAAEDFSPLGVLEETISNPRYDVIDTKEHPWGQVYCA